MRQPWHRDTSKQKQTVYFPEDILDEIVAEARRQGRSLSWLIQQAWKIAHPTIGRFPQEHP